MLGLGSIGTLFSGAGGRYATVLWGLTVLPWLRHFSIKI